MRKRLTEQQHLFISGLPELYGDALLKYAVRFLGYKPHLQPMAEDAVQEAWLKAIENVESLMQHDNLAAWLKLCVKRSLLNRLRAASHQREELTEYVTYHPAASAQAMEAALDRWQKAVTLREVQEVAAMLLTPAEQRVFDIHFLYGYTAEETAMLEQIPVSTVSGRINRIRNKLKKYFRHVFVLLFVMCYIKWR